MAILNNPLYRDYHGHIDKLIVIKQYVTKTVLTAYPDMSKVIFSDKQIAEQNRFKQAVAYAQSIVADPVLKAAYKVRLEPGKRVYNAAIAEFMRKPAPQRKEEEKVIWLADATGTRPFSFLSSSSPQAVITKEQKRPEKDLSQSNVIPDSAKRPFERRITEDGINQVKPWYPPLSVHTDIRPPV